jgi:hypothetical protein
VRFDIVDINPPNFIKSTARGEDDGKASFVKVDSLFSLKEIKSNRTGVSYDVDVTIQGALGRVAHPMFKAKMTQMGNVLEENVKRSFCSFS